MKPDLATKPGKDWKWGRFIETNGHGHYFWRWFRYGDQRPTGYFLETVW